MKRSITMILAAGILACTAARGAVMSVVPSPTGVPVEVTRATPLTLGWLVAANTAGTMYSAQGSFHAPDGSVLGVVNQTLTQSLAGPGNAVFVENMVVPENVVIRAHLMGHEAFVYRRKFSDGRTEVMGTVALHVAAGAGANMRFANTNPGASSGSFDVYRLALAFDGSAPLASVGRDGSLTAKAKVGYSTGGIIDASWEVAGPDSNEYRTLAPVKQFLDASGEVVLQSHPLPTGAKGVYSVRLHVTTPALQVEAPELRYVVTEN